MVLLKRFVVAVSFLIFFATVNAQFDSWKYSGSFYINTTENGSFLPESESVKDFPVLLRLNKDFFDFSQTMVNGEDLRFATPEGKKLFFQIEKWDSNRGDAAIWIRIPLIKGNEQQEIRVYWGRQNAETVSNGREVFNESNGYVGVWHMDRTVKDELGNVRSIDRGSKDTTGIIGDARVFRDGAHIYCGDTITTYPAGNEDRTTEAWVFAEIPGWAVDWGAEKRCMENSLRLSKPPVIKHEGYLCDAIGSTMLDFKRWYHFASTLKDGELSVYVNGKKDGSAKREFITPDTSYLRIGKRHNSSDNRWGRQWWNGSIDEVRISNTARSDAWLKLQYENQNPLQKLTGPVFSEKKRFKVKNSQIRLAEGESTSVHADISGAAKVYWIIIEDNNERVVAVDRKTYFLQAGRVDGSKDYILRCKAIYGEKSRSEDIHVHIQETIPEPVFTIHAPENWDGRHMIEVVPEVLNMKEMQESGAGSLSYNWDVSGVAVGKLARNEKLILKRAQGSGRLFVSLAIDNGGVVKSESIEISVKEPLNDPWVTRNAGADEKPVDNQFFARNDKGYGTLYYRGTLSSPADSVILKVYGNNTLYKRESSIPGSDRKYAFSITLTPGLIQYNLAFYSKRNNEITLLDSVSNMVCGDAYIIQGQSNAEAYDYGKAVNPYTSKWIRSFGSASPDPQKARVVRWGEAVSFDRDSSICQIGYWGIELARQLVENYQMPVCILNGAKGGTRIDEHQRNPGQHNDVSTIYGRLLWRVKQAGLTHGIRAVLWHQGEADQDAIGPLGEYGWENYQQYFVDLSTCWKEDFPNIQYYYIFQIWPGACGSRGISNNVLREKQRTLPLLYSNMRIMSTLGIRPPGGCHFPPQGYAQFARLIGPLLEKDIYGKKFERAPGPPNLTRIYYKDVQSNEIILEFDQDILWNDVLKDLFYISGSANQVLSGRAVENKLYLKIAPGIVAQELSYLDSRFWNQDNILYGKNGIAALSFWDVPVDLLDDEGNTAVVEEENIYADVGDFVAGEPLENSVLSDK